MSATPKTYRKKPVEIEAMQFTGSDHHAVYCWVEDHIPTYCYLSNDHVGVGVSINPANGAFIICTLEGEMTVSDGDYVIRGVQGEFYPCKSDIFEATYEPLEYDDDCPPAPIRCTCEDESEEETEDEETEDEEAEA